MLSVDCSYDDGVDLYSVSVSHPECVFLIFSGTAFSQSVETAYVLKLVVAAQTAPSSIEVAGAGFMLGLAFSGTVAESQIGRGQAKMVNTQK